MLLPTVNYRNGTWLGTNGQGAVTGNVVVSAHAASIDALYCYILIWNISLYLIFHIAAASGGVDYHPQGKGSGLWHGVELLKTM